MLFENLSLFPETVLHIRGRPSIIFPRKKHTKKTNGICTKSSVFIQLNKIRTTPGYSSKLFTALVKQLLYGPDDNLKKNAT